MSSSRSHILTRSIHTMVSHFAYTSHYVCCSDLCHNILVRVNCMRCTFYFNWPAYNFNHCIDSFQIKIISDEFFFSQIASGNVNFIEAMTSCLSSWKLISNIMNPKLFNSNRLQGNVQFQTLT